MELRHNASGYSRRRTELLDLLGGLAIPAPKAVNPPSGRELRRISWATIEYERLVTWSSVYRKSTARRFIRHEV